MDENKTIEEPKLSLYDDTSPTSVHPSTVGTMLLVLCLIFLSISWFWLIWWKRKTNSNVVHFYKIEDKANFPRKATPRSAAYDLYSNRSIMLPVDIATKIPTGIAIHFPLNYHGKIESRSGLCLHPGITTMGGVIDEDYTGQIYIVLKNFSKQPVDIKRGDRIGQIIIAWTPPIESVFHADKHCKPFANTQRGDNGFGSSGI